MNSPLDRGDRAFAQELLDSVLEALEISRENKALVVARYGIVIRVNELASHLFGWPGDELLGTTVTSLFEEIPSTRRDAIQRRETTLKAATGEPIAVEIGRQPIGRQLREVDVYAIRDLRERRAAREEQEKHSRALQQRDTELRSQKLWFEMALKSLTQGL